MANYSRWEDVKNKRPEPSAVAQAGVEQDLALGQLIYGLRTEAGLSQRELAERMVTTQSGTYVMEHPADSREALNLNMPTRSVRLAVAQVEVSNDVPPAERLHQAAASAASTCYW